MKFFSRPADKHIYEIKIDRKPYDVYRYRWYLKKDGEEIDRGCSDLKIYSVVAAHWAIHDSKKVKSEGGTVYSKKIKS